MTLAPTNKNTYTGAFATRAAHREYLHFIDSLSERLDHVTEGGLRPVFTCGLGGEFWQDYLNSFDDAGDRQYHTCRTCEAWFKTYADLCVIHADGSASLALWPQEHHEAPLWIKPAVRKIQARFRLEIDRRRLRPFLSKEEVWGVPVSNDWEHFHVVPPKNLVIRSHLAPHQLLAAKQKDELMVSQFLREHPLERLELVRSLLRSGQLPRSEAHLPTIGWLLTLQGRIRQADRATRERLLTLAAATAGSGFCHARSGMIGMLASDLAAGLSSEQVLRRYRAAMDPLQYRRPQAAPAAQTVAQAEKLVAELGIAASLQRRFLGAGEVRRTIWTPPERKKPEVPGVFGHLLESESAPFQLKRPITMTWEKFAREVLPEAQAIDLQSRYGSWVGMATAVDPEAPPILEWDREDRRNPVSWYQFVRGSRPLDWGLPEAGTWWPVTGITDLPCHWDEPNSRYQKLPLLLVAGGKCRKNDGLGLFPEILTGKLHGVRSVIEAHSNKSKLADVVGDQAIGYEVSSSYPVSLQVTTKGGVEMRYTIDRLD